MIPKAEPFKQWLAQIARERLEEMQDPELTIDRAKKLFNELLTNKVKYHDVDSYQSLLNIMQGLWLEKIIAIFVNMFVDKLLSLYHE